MHSRFFIKPAAILLIIFLAFSAVCGCARRKDDAASPTAVPTASAEANASAEPSATQEPEVTAAPDTTEQATEEASASPEPGSTEQPATAAPDVTEANATPSPAYTQQPGQTQGPVQTAVPVTAAPTATVRPTSEPVQPSTPTPKPTETPQPDPVTTLTNIEPGGEYYCDLDFDGRAEKIVLGVKDRAPGQKLITLMVTVGRSGIVLVDSFVMERYIGGVINNFNTGDNRVEIVVSSAVGARDETIRGYRLSDDSAALLTTSFSGRMEAVNGNTISVMKYADLMGTWTCMNQLGFGYDSFALVPINEEWYVKNEPGRLCTVSDPMFVGFYSSGSDNEFGYLQGGLGADKIYPVSTDLVSRIDFITDGGVRGYMEVTFDADCAAFFEGSPMDNWFSDLTFIQ